MSERTTAEIVADLRETRVTGPVSTGTKAGMSSTSTTTYTKASALAREAADRLADFDEMVNVSLDAELTAYETELARIDALLPDGVSIEQLVATYNAVWDDRERRDGGLGTRDGSAFVFDAADLRGVKP